MPDLNTEHPCPKCGKWKPATDFIDGDRSYKYCEACRIYAREAMQRHHARRRLGTRVQRGRPSTKDLSAVRLLTFTVPTAIAPEIEAYVSSRTIEWLQANTDHNTAALLPPNLQLGSNLNKPETPRGQPKVSRSSKRGARSAEDEAFLENCKPHIADALREASAPIFNLRRQQWVAQGSPPDWSPPSKKDKEATASAEPPPAQPSGDQNGQVQVSEGTSGPDSSAI